MRDGVLEPTAGDLVVLRAAEPAEFANTIRDSLDWLGRAMDVTFVLHYGNVADDGPIHAEIARRRSAAFLRAHPPYVRPLVRAWRAMKWRHA